MKIITFCAVTVAALLSGPTMTAETQPGATSPVVSADKDPKPAAEAVTRALRESPEITSKDISVTTHASAVVLGGKVASDAEAAHALNVAEKAAAGVRVISSLEAADPSAGPVPAPAPQLVRDVEAALRNDPRTAELTVTVSMDEKKAISLHGLVPSTRDRSAAQSVALKVKGVTQLHNQLATPGG